MFAETISSITPLDIKAIEKCQLRLDNLTKPLGSLHFFEKLASQMAGITGNHRPQNLKKSIILMYDNNETKVAPKNEDFNRLRNLINVFAEHVLAKMVLVDIKSLLNLPLSCSIAQETAMTHKQAMQAIEAGIKIARQEIKKGVQVLGIGDIGVSNLIPSAAIIACYSNLPLNELTGPDSQFIEATLPGNCPDKNDALDVLSKLGSLEIAGLVGVILGAAANRAAVVLDGQVTSAAALIATKMAPLTKEFLIGSHFPPEPAHKVALELMDLPAYLYLDMYLGHGTGAALGMSLINAALHVLNDMKTFGEAKVAVAQDGPGALKQSKDITE